MRRLAAALFASLFAFAPPLQAESILVFAAASLKEALDTAVKLYEAGSADKVTVSYAGSNALARQIEAGAPASIFLSADTEWADYVEKRGLAVAGSRRNLLANELVLVAPATSGAMLRIAPGFDLAAALGNGRLAIADPKAVPAGRYAKAALVSLNAWRGVEKRIAPAESVRAALALVARGETPLGIVYRTDALAEKGVKIVDTFPQAAHPAIVYPLLLLKGAGPGARSLSTHLASERMRPTWERFGFRVVR